MIKFLNKINSEYVIIFSDLSKLLMLKKIDFNHILKSTEKVIDILLKNKNTIIIPTYNLGFPKKKKTSYSEKFITTGILAKTIIKKYNFKRTHRPMYNYAVLGLKENTILNLKQTTAWGDDSVIGFLGRNKSYGLGIGINYKKFTWVTIHACEETLKVPYRFYKIFKGYHLDKKKKVNEKMFVRYLNKPKKNLEQTRLLSGLIKKKQLIKYNLNNINFCIIDLHKYYKGNLKYLKKLDIWGEKKLK